MKRLPKLALTLALLLSPAFVLAESPGKSAAPKFVRGDMAPEFKIKSPSGEVIDLAKLSARGPVLVRLTCGCSGCDKELAYFREVSEAYKASGLTSLYVFKEPDEKVAKYVKDKKLNFLYAVDTKGKSWEIFRTKTMPTNFLIEKGGKIISIASGCETTGLLAQAVSKEAAKLVDSKAVDVKAKVDGKK